MSEEKWVGHTRYGLDHRGELMPLVDAWRLEHARQERDEAQARALKYEQALREIERLAGKNLDGTYYNIARAALDKPGTEGENSANEVENRYKQAIDELNNSKIKP